MSAEEKRNSELLKEFLNDYKKPSFGSLSKREIDLRVFELLVETGVVDPNAPIFSLISTLKVSRAKARALVYDYNLRKKDGSTLKDDLKELLKEGSVEKEKYIKIEIDNPYLIDYIRNILRDKRLIADGSFKPELLVLSMNAYSCLLEACLSDEEQAYVRRQLYGDSLAKEAFSAIALGLVEKYAGEKTAESLINFGKLAIEQKGSSIKAWFRKLTTDTQGVEE